MSDTDSEIQAAAANGAAAAVNAVQDEQDRQETEQAMASETIMATDAAETAAERAEQAAEAAESATEAAVGATEVAQQAQGDAQQAAEVAMATRQDVDGLRTEFRDGIGGIRAHLDSLFEKQRPTDEPTEVVVTHGGHTEASTNGPDSGGDGSARPNGTADAGSAAVRRRHRFGKR